MVLLTFLSPFVRMSATPLCQSPFSSPISSLYLTLSWTLYDILTGVLVLAAGFLASSEPLLEVLCYSGLARGPLVSSLYLH